MNSTGTALYNAINGFPFDHLFRDSGDWVIFGNERFLACDNSCLPDPLDHHLDHHLDTVELFDLLWSVAHHVWISWSLR